MKDNPIDNQVLYGLDSINEDRTVEVNLKQFLLVYKTIEELVSFFHQPDHYSTITDVQEYMGNKEQGMYSILSRIYYQEFDTMLPGSVRSIVEADAFENPIRQYYKGA